MHQFICVGPYKDDYRDIARKVKAGNKEAITTAAYALRAVLPDDAMLIPAPGHTGVPTYTLDLCRAIAAISRYPLCDCLRGTPHEGLCELKNKEYTEGHEKGSLMPDPSALGVHLTRKPLPGKRPCVIDNVIASGTTAAACLSVLPENSLMVVIACDYTYPKVQEISDFKAIK